MESVLLIHQIFGKKSSHCLVTMNNEKREWISIWVNQSSIICNYFWDSYSYKLFSHSHIANFDSPALSLSLSRSSKYCFRDEFSQITNQLFLFIFVLNKIKLKFVSDKQFTPFSLIKLHFDTFKHFKEVKPSFKDNKNNSIK